MRAALAAVIIAASTLAAAAQPIRDDRYFVAWGGMGQDVIKAMRCAHRPCRHVTRQRHRSRAPRTVPVPKPRPKALARGLVEEVQKGAAEAAKPISGLAAVAGRYLGGNPTGWRRAWCGNFMRLVVRQAGLPDHKGGNLARNWSHYGRASSARVGAIGVMPHHVGIVIGRCRGGGILLRSGNHGRRVGDGCYAARRFIAFRSTS